MPPKGKRQSRLKTNDSVSSGQHRSRPGMPAGVRRSKRIQEKADPDSTLQCVDLLAEEVSSKSMSEESKPDSQDGENESRQARHPKRQKFEEDVTKTKEVVARHDPKHVRGRRGFLKYIAEMPLDVLYEILRDLEPIDLLHLSWANKGLNTIVMNKSARFIWKDAFDRLYESDNPPPGCPADLSLAQYTCFLFGKRCMKCNVVIGHYTSWAFRLRICWNCLPDRFVTKAECKTNYKPFNYSRHFESHFDCFRYIVAKGKMFYSRDEIEEYGRRYQARFEDTEGYSDFQQRLEDERREKLRDSARYSEWNKVQVQGRKWELEDIQSERRTMIYQPSQSTRTTGWSDSEIMWLTSTREPDREHMLGITKNKRLTEKGLEWKNLSVKLVNMLEASRARREERLAHTRRVRLVQSRYKALASRYNLWRDQQELNEELLPRLQDLALQEPLKSALFGNLDSEEIPDFTIYDDDIRRFAEEWIVERDAYLVNLLPQELTTSSSEGNKSKVLRLATVYFSCPNTIEWSYSEICNRRLYRYNDHTPSPEEVSWLEVSRPWNLDRHNITFHWEAYNAAKNIIAVCGADPASATTSHMDERSFKLLCLRCSGEDHTIDTSLFTWRTAIHHACAWHTEINEHQPDHIENDWRLVTNAATETT